MGYHLKLLSSSVPMLDMSQISYLIKATKPAKRIQQPYFSWNLTKRLRTLHVLRGQSIESSSLWLEARSTHPSFITTHCIIMKITTLTSTNSIWQHKEINTLRTSSNRKAWEKVSIGMDITFYRSKETKIVVLSLLILPWFLRTKKWNSTSMLHLPSVSLLSRSATLLYLRDPLILLSLRSLLALRHQEQQPRV